MIGGRLSHKDEDVGQRKIDLLGPLILAVAVFLACLFGIYTRPLEFLANVWPANAIMLGLMLRKPSTATFPSWVSAAAAFMAADLLTGSSLFKALLLNSANLAGVTAAYATCLQLSQEKLRLHHPSSVLDLAFAFAVGAATAGIIGGLANPILFNGGVISGWTFWFATEFVNYVAIVPVILSAPRFETFRFRCKEVHSTLGSRYALPALALLFSGLAGMIIKGPGAIAFPVPALLWCGVVYPVFTTALLTLLFALWSLMIISGTYLLGQQGLYDETALTSLRMAASLIALGPIMLAVVMRSREELLSTLRYLATHDQLTGVVNRHAFHESAGKIANVSLPFAALMIDIDHFKAVNDNYGHAAGDEVLVSFVQRLRSCLRPDDVLGRIGGEEFAVVIPNCQKSEAIRIAERIREAVRGAPIALNDSRIIQLTASIGLSLSPETGKLTVEHVLANADAALYRAKTHGRDRVELLECTGAIMS